MSGRPLSLHSSEAPHDTSSVLASSRRPYGQQQQTSSSESPYPDGSSAGPASLALQDVFSDEFSLEPLDDHPGSSSSNLSHSLSRRSRLSNKSSSTTLLATEDGNESHLSPFRDPDPSESSPEDMSDLPGSSKAPTRNNHANVPSQSSSVARAPSNASSTTQGTPSVSHRSVSTSSRFSIPRALSPYTGQTGPSHPYAMYPQGIAMGRTSSVSSSSTIRPPDRNAVGVMPPQHPYAMYPQNTVPEEGLEEQATPPSIPVGFPGHEPRFTSNRRTPDELGDIVGVDGHTEQLPPYSRYPDGIPPKSDYQSPIAMEETTREVEGASPVSPHSGVSSRILLREGGAVAPQSMADNNPPPPDDEGGGLKERLARKGQQKVCCGVPIWVFALVGVVLCIGAAIGGAIGGILGTKQGEKAGGASASSSLSGMPPTSVFVTVTATPLLDATPLSITPTNILPLPTGSFSMSASALSAQGNQCIDDPTYGSSWGCIQTGQFQCSIEDDDENFGGKILELESQGVIDGNFVYGPQLPFLAKNEFHTRLMHDKTNMSLGPAMFVYTPFDKLVIISEEDFPPGDSVSGRELLQRSSHQGRKVLGQPGDRPFFCWWNSTYLEIFVYLNETSQAATATLSSSQPLESQPPSTTDSAILPIESSTEAYGTSHDVLLPRSDGSHYYKPFPRVVKMEEKRVQSSGVPAYCEQMQVLEDYRIGGPIGRPVTIDESDPTPTTSTSVIPVQPRIRRDEHDSPPDEGNCFCRWFAN